MKIIYIVALIAVLVIGLEQNAHAAEKFVTNQTVTYQIVKWTNDDHVTNEDLTVILEEAILEWETLNPGLKFEKAGSNPDVVIRWENFPELGTATCEGECTRSDTIDYTVRLSIGTEDCLGEFAYMSREYIKRVAVHELGHTLGITHTWDRDSVMYGQIMYDGGYLKPVGFDSYNIPKSTIDWFEGEEELWYDVRDTIEQIKHLDALVSTYDSRLVAMDDMEAGFLTAFEGNRLATRDVLTEMTVTTDRQMVVLEHRLGILQSDLDDLDERYERHSQSYETWKSKLATANAELTAQEKLSDSIVESLVCFPLTSEEQVMEWVGMLANG